MTAPIGPQAVTGEWVARLASLVHAIRPDWQEPGIKAALARLGGKPLADVTLAAVAAAITRTDQRTPAIIAADGAHWRILNKPAEQHRADVIPLTCEHGARPSRCDQCTARRGVPLDPDLRARMHADITAGRDAIKARDLTRKDLP